MFLFLLLVGQKQVKKQVKKGENIKIRCCVNAGAENRNGIYIFRYIPSFFAPPALPGQKHYPPGKSSSNGISASGSTKLYLFSASHINTVPDNTLI